MWMFGVCMWSSVDPIYDGYSACAVDVGLYTNAAVSLILCVFLFSLLSYIQQNEAIGKTNIDV